MDVTPLIASDRQVIQSYSPGRFRVSGTGWDGAVIVFPGHTESWPAAQADVAALTPDHFQSVIDRAGMLDVLLLGCGDTMPIEALSLRAALKRKGLAVEVMDTGAACRTYNVLMAEGRRVAAALLPVTIKS